MTTTQWPKLEPRSPLLNLATYPPTVLCPSTWLSIPPPESSPSRWKKESAQWRKEQILRLREERKIHQSMWLAFADAARTCRRRAHVRASSSVTNHPRQVAPFVTPSKRAALTEPAAPSASASSRTANATLGAPTSPLYWRRLKESWRQLAEHVARHEPAPKSEPEPIASQTATPLSMPKKMKKSRPAVCEEGGEDDGQG